MSDEDFKHIVHQYQDRIYNTCLGFLKNAEDAEDMAQEVFMQVFGSYDHFLGKSEVGTWLYKIAVNKCLEHLRKQKTQKRMGQLADVDGLEIASDLFYHPGVQLENKERAAVLLHAIGQLSENQQTTFTLHKVEGLSYEEIGKIMNKSTPSVESLMHRAKLKLQELLQSYYEKN